MTKDRIRNARNPCEFGVPKASPLCRQVLSVLKLMRIVAHRVEPPCAVLRMHAVERLGLLRENVLPRVIAIQHNDAFIFCPRVRFIHLSSPRCESPRTLKLTQNDAARESGCLGKCGIGIASFFLLCQVKGPNDIRYAIGGRKLIRGRAEVNTIVVRVYGSDKHGINARRAICA